MLDIERRIPRNLGGTDTLLDDAPLVGTVEFTDGIVAFGPAMFTLFISNKVLPNEYGWVGLLAAMFVAFGGIVFLLAKPDYLTLSDWLKNYREFKQRPSKYQKHIATDGGYDASNGVPASSHPDTRKFTQVEKIHPGAAAIERTDGTMVGIVKLGGLNLDTSTGTEWNDAAEDLANFFNSQLEDDIQFFLPMRQFDPTDQMNMYLDRLDDEDGQSNLMLREYLKDRAAWMQGIAAQSFIREFYVIVEVDPYDVLSDELKQGDFERNLKNVPGGDALGDFLDGIRGGDRSSELTESEVKNRQLRELDRRRNEIMSGLSLGGRNKTEVVDADHVGVLLKEYWEGVTVREDEAKNYVRKKPFVTGGNDTVAGDSR